MSETWIQNYILLAFRLHKVVQARYGSPFVEGYYGPLVWRAQVEAEPEMEASDLVRQAMTLADTLPIQGFASSRVLYLSKQVKAMETVGRKLSGESFQLLEEARNCLDISPTWTPEEQFEQAHMLYEAILPGTGSLAERLHAYTMALAFPLDQTHVLTGFIEQAFVEARKRTCAFLELPEGEMIEIEYRPSWEHDAAAYYKGSYRTHIIMNVSATAKHVSRLFDHKVCHEGYPGHHTEYVLKELHLARKEAYLEHTLDLTLCPQCVLTEGIAMVAHEMIFSEGEAERWITEQVYRPLQKEVDPTVLVQLRRASEMLVAVWDNAAILLDEGRPEQDVAQYFARYMLSAKDRTSEMVAHLRQPMQGLYTLTYAAGRSLMRSWLQGPDKVSVFSRFLTSQLTPSQLQREKPPV